MPLISVVIPVYNGEKTVRETIESVLSQTFSDFEILVIDDGSQDSTVDIVSSIQDPRLKVFSYPNSGVSASRNRGMSHASGEFISFLDADDLWTPDKLEAQLRALQENPQAAVAYSWNDYIDESSHIIKRGVYINATGDVYAKLLVVNFLQNGSNPLIRREALTQVGGFDESLSGPADWDLWLRLAKQYHFVVVPYPQVLYRLSVDSMSSNVSGMEAQTLKVIDRAFTQAPASLQHLKKQSIANLYKYLAFKALEGLPRRDKGLASARFLWQATVNDPSLFRQRRTMSNMLLRASVGVLLPTQQAQALLTTINPTFRPFI